MSKFKVGDKVRILDGSEIKDYTATWCSDSMGKYVGEVHKVREITSYENKIAYCLEGCNWYKFDERGLELASKFKVGDKVIGNEKANYEYTITREGWVGTVAEVTDNVIYVQGKNSYTGREQTFGVREECFDLYEDLAAQKIIITTDGKTTTAVLYDGKKRIKDAKASCAPSDTFDFGIGSALAVERLMGNPKATLPEDETNSEYFTGKVRCTVCKNSFLTKGKIYEFVNGHSVDDDGNCFPRATQIKSLEHLNKTMWSTFEEVVDNWDKFIAGEIAFEMTADKFDAFLKEVEERFPKLRWCSGDKPTGWRLCPARSNAYFGIDHNGRLCWGSSSHKEKVQWPEKEGFLNAKVYILNGHDGCTFKAGETYEIKDGEILGTEFPYSGKIKDLDDLKYYFSADSVKDSLKHSENLTHHCREGVEYKVIPPLDWKKFAEGNLEVKVSKDKYDEFMKLCEEKNFVFKNGSAAVEWNPWKAYDEMPDFLKRLIAAFDDKPGEYVWICVEDEEALKFGTKHNEDSDEYEFV